MASNAAAAFPAVVPALIPVSGFFREIFLDLVCCLVRDVRFRLN